MQSTWLQKARSSVSRPRAAGAGASPGAPAPAGGALPAAGADPPDGVQAASDASAATPAAVPSRDRRPSSRGIGRGVIGSGGASKPGSPGLHAQSTTCRNSASATTLLLPSIVY